MKERSSLSGVTEAVAGGGSLSHFSHTLPYLSTSPPTPPHLLVFFFFLVPLTIPGSCVNPSPVDWVPRGGFLAGPGPRPHPAAACLTGFVCKELSARGRGRAVS